MGSRDAEHEHWNLQHGLKPNERLALYCPRCGKPHRETLTSDPLQPDYFHHVHQCTECGLRFDVYVRCRSTMPAADVTARQKPMRAPSIAAMPRVVEAVDPGTLPPKKDRIE